MSYTDEQLIAQHLLIKNARDAEEKVWDTRRGELNRMMQSIEGILNARILAKGKEANSISTPAGIAYQRTMTYCRVADKEAFEKYVRETGDTSFVKWDVDRDGVEKFMEAYQGHTPPGVTVTRIKQTLTRSA